MTSKTFAERYCEIHGLPLERFAPVVFKKCLYPHARLCRGLVEAIYPEHFAADYDFVHDTGRLMRCRDFDLALSDFMYHPANRGLWRRMLRMRVSSHRLRRLVREIMRSKAATSDDTGTNAPFTSRG